MRTELLFVIAEISVAFAGFAGLVVAISRRGQCTAERARLDLIHLRNVLAQGLFALGFSLAPVMLADMGFSVSSAWRASAALFAATFGAYCAHIVREGFAGYRESQQRVPLLYRFNVVVSVAMVATLALCAAGVLPVAAYLPVLGLCLLGAGTSFVRVFLSVARDDSGA